MAKFCPIKVDLIERLYVVGTIVLALQVSSYWWIKLWTLNSVILFLCGTTYLFRKKLYFTLRVVYFRHCIFLLCLPKWYRNSKLKDRFWSYWNTISDKWYYLKLPLIALASDMDESTVRHSMMIGAPDAYCIPLCEPRFYGSCMFENLEFCFCLWLFFEHFPSWS